MNGFANAILSLLLGWLRSLFNAMWALLGSQSSGVFIDVLRNHWKMIFLVMCVGGFVVDRVVYLIRWQPYRLWKARRKRNRQSPDDADYSQDSSIPYSNSYQSPYAPSRRYPSSDIDTEVEPYPEEYAQDEPASYDGDATLYRPQTQSSYQPEYRSPVQSQNSAYAPPVPFAPQTFAPPSAYAQPPYNQAAQVAYAPDQPRSVGRADFRRGDTTVFSPDASFAPTISYSALPFSAPVEPEPFVGEPRFDDDPAVWNAPQSMFEDFAPRLSPDYNPAAGMKPVFGTSQPEPIRYLQDMQPTYAAQVEPEMPYTRPVEPSATEPVHPGLDIETFQQNIGLTNTNALNDSSHRDAAEAFPNFSPFPVAAQPETVDGKPRGLGAFAKKARNFVSGEDERNPRTIRDMQPTTDVKNAFHAPVYPKKKSESEEE